uniref:D-alanyl-D-alanine carboxypeptidase family protein n=1 Tax=Eubacterium sp. TaxID=142586 RepID=UPI004027C1D1
MKKILCYILTLCLLMSSSICVFAQDENADTNSANENGIVDYSKSSILMCADTGDIIYEKNAYEHVSPASVTKLMSMLLVLEAIDSGKITLEDKVTAGENAVAMGGSQIWLEVGETMTVEELLKAVIVASANDACTA